MKGLAKIISLVVLVSSLLLSSIMVYGQTVTNESLSNIEGLFTIVATVNTTPFWNGQDANQIVFSDDFEASRADDSTLPVDFFYRSDTSAANLDEKAWPWKPLSNDGFQSNRSLKYDLSVNLGENLLSRSFLVSSGPLKIEFYIKTNMSLIGGPDDGMEFLFYRTQYGNPVCIDELRYKSRTIFTTIQRETQIDVTSENIGTDWEKVSMMVGGCQGATNGIFYITSAPDRYSGWVLVDNLTVSKIAEGQE